MNRKLPPSVNAAPAKPSISELQIYRIELTIHKLTCIFFLQFEINYSYIRVYLIFLRATQTSQMITGTANGSNESNTDATIERPVAFGRPKAYTLLSTNFSI